VNKIYDIIVIGGGIVGLATALKIQEKNPKAKTGNLKRKPK
jgi:L-2-hydroxyglutarate oxidase